MHEEAITGSKAGLCPFHDLPSTYADEDSTEEISLPRAIIPVALLLTMIICIDNLILRHNRDGLYLVHATAVSNLVIMSHLFYFDKAIDDDRTVWQKLDLDRCLSVSALSLSLAQLVKMVAL